MADGGFKPVRSLGTSARSQIDGGHSSPMVPDTTSTSFQAHGSSALTEQDNVLAQSPQHHDWSSKNIGDGNCLETEMVMLEVGKNKTFVSLGKKQLRPEKGSELPKKYETPDVYGDINLDKFNTGAQCDIGQITAISPATARKEAEFHMDKVVAEIERPKMFECFQKGTHQVVKDVCVDDRMHSCNKVSQLNDKLDHRKVYAISHSTEDECDIPTNKKPVFDSSGPLHVFENPFFDTDKKSVMPSSVDTMTIYQQGERMMGNVSYEKVNVHLHQESDHKKGQINLLNAASNSRQHKFVERDNTPENDCSDGQLPANQDSPKTLNANSTSEESVFDSDVKANTLKLSVGSLEPHLIEQATVGSISAQDYTDSSTSVPRSSVIHYGHTESIMHGPGCLSDRVSHDWQRAYLASPSIRSESSTTSTRSFAFPILQPEWNSSPVKMAKADRKLYRKHRGWRAGLMCCNF